MLKAVVQDLALQLAPGAWWTLLVLAAGMLGGLLYVCFARARLLRVVQDTPTAWVGSAAQGFVEIEDRDDLVAAARALLRLLRIGGRGRVIEQGRSHDPFLIRDASGACIVDPGSARIVGARRRVWTAGRRRFEESVIPAGSRLYALGLFMTPPDLAADLERREIGALVSTWKLNQLELAARFDANGDGVVDDAELAAAWRAAAAEVRSRHRGLEPELHVLCKPSDRRPFVLSLIGQERLVSRLWFQSLVALLGSGVVALLLAWALAARGLS
jgi:hypothetical protein